MLLSEAGFVFIFLGLILCNSGPVKEFCSNRTSARGNLKLRLEPKMVTEGQTVTMTCGGKCQLSPNTAVSWFRNNQPLKTQKDPKKLFLEAVTRDNAGKYICVMTFGNNNISSDVETLIVISIPNINTSAAAIGAAAAVLVTIPVMVFIWFRTKRTSAQSSTAEGTDNREQLDQDPMYENIPARGATEQDDLYYSTIHFCPTVQPRQPTEHEHEHAPYTAVNFRPYV